MIRIATRPLTALVPIALAMSFVAASCSEPDVPPVPSPVPDQAASDDVNITEADNDKTVMATPGQSVILTLPENVSTGYTWQPLEEVDENVLQQTGDTEIPPAEAIPGAAGQHEWTFMAQGPGSTKIVLASVPPGEEVDNKYESFSVTVEVSEAD